MAIVNGYRIKGWANPYRAAMLALVALLVPLPSSDAMPPLRVAFSEDADSIVVGEIEPGSEVLYLEVSRSVGAWVPRTSTRSELARDEDKDSEVRIPIEGDVPAKFFAVAVETASGRFGILAPDTPEGVPAREIAFPADAFGEGPERRFDRLDDRADLTAILLVRPGDGGGAWSLVTGDSSPFDESPGDGVVTTSANALQPIGKSGPPPEEYEKDDLLVRFAPRAGEYYVTRIVR